MQGGKETFTPELGVCLGLARRQAAGQALPGAEHGDRDKMPAGTQLWGHTARGDVEPEGLQQRLR